MIRFLKSAADFVAAMVVEGKSAVVEESPAALAARSAQPEPLTFLIFLKRFGVVLCMSALAWLILLVTPPLDRTFLSCERPCHELDWPMICRIKLTLEVYQTLSWSCGECPSNQTDCFNANCVTADGVPQGLLTANRQLPGPSIQVCENDILVVDVWNRVPGAGVGVHWRGMTQKETPFMDGVPMVTQCPIPAHTTFQYKFRASKAGTHLWHAHAGAESADGLFGALIVRQPSSRDPQRRHYDVDDMDHVVVIAEWARGFALQRLADAHHKPSADATMGGRNLVDTLLINGRGKLHPSDIENEMDVDLESDEVEKKEKPSSASESPMATFNVRPGLRHRFRMANAGGVAGCPVRVSIDNHLLKVIALDGNPIQTAQVKSFVLSPGERADFVVTADQPIGDYWMRASADKAEGKELHPNCRSLKQKAIIHYKSSDYKPKLNFAFPEKLSSYPSPHNHPSNSEEGDATAKVLLNSVDDACIEETDSLCVTEVHSLHKLDPDLAVPKVDRTIYLPFDFQLVATDNVSYPPFLVPGTKDVRVPRVANLTFMYPPSPLVTQASDVPYDLRCSQDLLPTRCPTTVAGKRREEGSATEKGDTDVCECVHQIDIGLGETVELVLVDEGGASDWGHVFHLHGYSFHVVALGSFESDVLSSNRIEALKDMDKKGKLTRNLVDPVVKDTVFIPSGGYAVLRFKADNPGYWLLHDQHISHSAWGLNVILHVGSDNQLPPTPPDFPKCGSWVGPEFFLI